MLAAVNILFLALVCAWIWKRDTQPLHKLFWPALLAKCLAGIALGIIYSTYYDPSDTRVLHEGLVITIEPFLSTKSRIVHERGDGWTLVGAPGNLSAQYEHTLIVTRGDPIVVTTH